MSALTCPSWCGGDHLDGGVHRGVVGDVLIGDKTVLVVIQQVPGGDPSVAVSGPVIVQVAPDDHDDAAALFALLGHDELGDLVRRAARIVEGEAR